MNKEWTAEKFEPAEEWYDELEDGVEYCVYCYEEAMDKIGCCGENHFLTGKEIKDYEKSSKTYDPPMTQTEEYLLNKEREEEHKSYDY
jgi:hypothetical protein